MHNTKPPVARRQQRPALRRCPRGSVVREHRSSGCRRLVRTPRLSRAVQANQPRASHGRAHRPGRWQSSHQVSGNMTCCLNAGRLASRSYQARTLGKSPCSTGSAYQRYTTQPVGTSATENCVAENIGAIRQPGVERGKCLAHLLATVVDRFLIALVDWCPN